MTAAARTPESDRSASEPIAIVGVGLRFPGGNDTFSQFTEFLRDGRSGVGPLPTDRWDVEAFTPSRPGEPGKIDTVGGGFLDRIDEFDPAFFNISPKEAQYIDPQQRMLLETAWKALEHADIDPTPLRRGNGGVYVGASSIDYALELDGLDYTALDGHLASGITMFPMSGRLSYFLGWRGPSATVDTACSSSLTALHMAVGGLRAGECDIALCAGVNAIHHPRITVMFSHAQMLAPDGLCKTFDEGADGYVRAEGCGVIVLKRLSTAQAAGDRVLAVIRGTAIGQDGESAGLTVPNGNAQSRVMRQALEAAALTPGDIQYVEAHGTGTPLGDPIELGGINDVFAASHSSDDPLVVGSVKTNLGHMEPASGMVGIIKVIGQLREQTIFPHLNMTTPSARIPWSTYPITVPVAAQPWDAPVRRAVINSFGFAGAIGAAVLEQAPATATPSPRPDPGLELLTVSGQSEAALRERLGDLLELIDRDGAVDVGALCATGSVGRSHLGHRSAAVVSDRRSVRAALERALQGTLPPRRSGLRKIAFLFSGQGTQYAGMAAAAYAAFPVFAAAVDECDVLFADHLTESVRDLLLGRGDRTALVDETAYTQAALFVLEFALYRLWASWGIRPSVVMGHSIGEVTAATVAGVFDLPDAVRVVAARGRLMQAVSAPGGMAAVGTSPDVLAPLLAPYPDLAFAAFNAPGQTVISGGTVALDAVCAQLESRGTRVDRLTVSHAFHSPLMAEVYGQFRAVLDTVVLHAPGMALISNVTGTPARVADVTDPDYWVRHIGEPVRFADGIRAALRSGRHAVLELGPSSALTALARQSVTSDDHAWLTSLRRKETDTVAPLLRALAGLYEAGATVDWAGFRQGRPVEHAELPPYPFQRRRYWLPNSAPSTSPGAGAALGAHPLLGRADDHPGAPIVVHTTVVAGGPGCPVVARDADEDAELPVAAYLEILLAVQEARFGSTIRPVRDIEIYEPVILAAEGGTQLRTECEAADDGTFAVRILTGPADASVLHVSAWLDAPDVTASVPPEPDPPLAWRAVRRVPGEDVFTDLDAVGRRFGPAFHVLDEVVLDGSGSVTARVRTRDPLPHEQLPVETVEAALLATGALSSDGPTGRITSVGRLHLFRKPRGRQLSMSARPSLDGAARALDVVLFDEQGAVARLDHVTSSVPQAPRGPESFVHRAVWTEDDDAASTADAVPAADDLPGTAEPTLRHVLTLGADLAGPRPHGPALRVTPVHLADLAAALTDDTVTDVSWTWRATAGAPTGESLRAETEANFREVLEVVGLLTGRDRPPRLWLVTRGAQRVGGDAVGNGSALASSTLWGFGASLLNESPALLTTMVDLAPEADAIDLFAEWSRAGTADHRIAYREGTRLVRRIVAAPPVVDDPGRVTLRADRTYVVLGGLGGLGVATATELVNLGARDIVLVSRSGDAAPEAAAAFLELLDRAKVRTFAVDVAEPGAVAGLFATVAEAGVPVGGVVHAAGAVGKCLVRSMDWPAIETQFGAKVFGAWDLHEAVRDLPDLDFFVAYSSIAGVIGGMTQAHYAGAGTYLDALTEWRAASGAPGVALSWGAWSALGMSARLDASLAAEITRGGIGFFSPHRGLHALREHLRAPGGSPIVGTYDWDAVVASAAVDNPLYRRVATPRATVRPELDVAELVSRGVDGLFAAVQEIVRGHVARALRMDDPAALDVEGEVRSFGLDSLMAMDVKTGLDRAFGLSLPASLAFDEPSIARMAGTVVRRIAGAPLADLVPIGVSV